MLSVSDKTEARVRAASTRYASAEAELTAAELEIAAAMAEHKADTGQSTEDIARMTVLKTSKAYRLLNREAARAPRDS
jgi:outer membrane protein TolC